MSAWQAVLLAFFVLLPLVLMLDFWGDERLTARGRPIRRPWVRQVRHPDVPEQAHGHLDEDASHGDLDEAQPAAPISGHRDH